jgi:hypothetical protein
MSSKETDLKETKVSSVGFLGSQEQEWEREPIFLIAPGLSSGRPGAEGTYMGIT